LLIAPEDFSMQINFIYAADVAGAPAAFKTALAAAASYLDALITNPVTINIQVGWGEDNGAAIPAGDLATGGPSSGIGMSYPTLKNELSSVATSIADKTMVANLSATDPTNGGTFFITAAQEKAWGLLSPTASEIDGTIGFSSTEPFSFNPNARAQPGTYDFIGTAEQEITHALGRFAGLQYAPGVYSPMDLVRYASPGKLELAKDLPSYFSINGGNTNLVPFDTNPYGDPGDWASGVLNDSFGYGYTNSTESVSATDVTLMDVLGYKVNAAAAPGDNYIVSDLTTGSNSFSAGTPYSGTVSGLKSEIVVLTSDNLNITSYTPNAFIHPGSGSDVIDVSQSNGNNVLDGSSGSDLLIGGTGLDTFYVDDRSARANIATAIANFHSGDNTTIWGVTPADFKLSWLGSKSAHGYTGLTAQLTAAGKPTTDITFAGYTTADLGTRLKIAYGTTQATPGNPATAYLSVHAA
jgi:hypothetical protein